MVINKLNSVLLPDGRVLVLGGFEMPPDGGPVEIFDPEDPPSGFQLGPNMKHARGYHSAAILLPDGSVIMGGDPNGGNTPNERYLPSYFFKPRPGITGAPASVTYGAAFSVNTPTAWCDRGGRADERWRSHPRLQPQSTLCRLRDHRSERDDRRRGGAA